MKCKRCGANEDRLNGFCSLRCLELSGCEQEIKELKLYCGFLEDLADSWMLEAAKKKLEEALSPDMRRQKLEKEASEAKARYDELFNAGSLQEAAPYYAKYLKIRALLASADDKTE